MLIQGQINNSDKLYAVEIMLEGNDWLLFESGDEAALNHLTSMANSLANQGHETRVVRFDRGDVVWKK